MISDDHNPEHFPGLNKAGKSNPFIAPEGYFDNLPNRINETIHKPAHASARPLWLTRFAMPAMAVVAMVWVISAVVKKPAATDTASGITLTNDHIAETGYLMQMDESLLLESLSSEELSEMAGDEGFQDYLIENKVDINLIINEL